MASRILRAFALVACVACVCATSRAQTLTLPAPAGEGLPGFEAPMTDGTHADHGVVAEEVPAPEEGFRPLAPIPMDQMHALPELDLESTVESSGTWLRRGLWYADLEGIVMTRNWDSNGISFAQEFDLFFNQQNFSVGAQVVPQVIPIQSAMIGESSPGAEGMARFSLGRFLFRDQHNRDHTAEMIAFGGGEFNESLRLKAILTGPGEGFGANGRDEQGLHVPLGVDGSAPLDVDTVDGLPSFDRADEMNLNYASRFYTFEWNYNVNQRMRSDRLELLPSGQWARRASPGFTWSYLAGFRYFDLEEQFDWDAIDIVSIDNPNDIITPGNGDADGTYRIRTSNNLFGVHLGLGLTYESDRWNVTVHSKHGFFANDARLTESLAYTDAPDSFNGDFTHDLNENSLAFVSQGGVTLRYHLRPNLSLRAGWEYLFVSGVALAPNNANFNPTKEQIGVTSDIFYQGVSLGTEYFW